MKKPKNKSSKKTRKNKGRCNSNSFVVELSLLPDTRMYSMLSDIFLIASRLTNVLIQHGKKIVKLIKNDSAWDLAKKMPRTTDDEKIARSKAFSDVRKLYGFSEFAFHREAIKHKNKASFTGRIGSNVTQKIATKVFKSFEEYLYGKRGQPRFMGKSRPVHSIEEKTHAGSNIVFDKDKATCKIRGMHIPVMIPDLAKDEWLASALQSKTKYCRIVWRNRGTKKIFYLQLIQEGNSPVKASVLAKRAKQPSKGGSDLGPSSVAWVTDTEAGLEQLCAGLDLPFKELRKIQRKVARQNKVNNPANFKEDGTIKKGKKVWVKSKQQLKTEAQLQKIHSKAARQRKNAHGVLTNKLLTKAVTWFDDNVSIKSLQKNYGRSVLQRSPGTFQDLLIRKAESAGGYRVPQNSRQLKTSQYDHSTNTFAPKKLSERWHTFGDGRGKVQRDVYSAFLARNAVCIDEVWSHDPVLLEQAWQKLQPYLIEHKLFIESDTPPEDRISICPLMRSGETGLNNENLTPSSQVGHATSELFAQNSSLVGCPVV